MRAFASLFRTTRNGLQHLQGRKRLERANATQLQIGRCSIPSLNKRTVTTLSLTSKKRKGNKITMVTAYDYPSAMHVQRAGIDILLVGDAAAMVELGFETTQPMTLDQMIHHCQAVKRGAAQGGGKKKTLLVGDMPLGTYEYKDVDIALTNAYRFVKEAGMDAVKLEVRLLPFVLLFLLVIYEHYTNLSNIAIAIGWKYTAS
jgi:hypothetical protein